MQNMLVPLKSNWFTMVRNLITLFICISIMGYIHFQITEANFNVSQTNRIIKAMLNNQTYWIREKNLEKLEKELNEKEYYQEGKKGLNNSKVLLNKGQAISQAQCLVKAYLNILKNEQILSTQSILSTKSMQSNLDNSSQSIKKAFQQPTTQSSQWKQLKFTQLLTLPLSSEHDLQNINSCSDLISILNYLNPQRMDFVYTNYVQQRYLGVKSDNQAGDKLNVKNNANEKWSQQKSQQPAQQTQQNANNLINDETKFCIIVNQLNTSSTKLRKNINSITQQTYQNYKLIILDNGSTDGSYQISKIVLQDIEEKDNQFTQGTVKKDTNQKLENKFNEDRKYQVVKEDKTNNNQWQLLFKHDKLCEGYEYIVLVDGRDELISRHVLSVLDSQINKNIAKKPDLIISSLLYRNHLSRIPAPLSNYLPTSYQNFPPYTFKTIKQSFLTEQMKQKILNQSKKYNSTYHMNLKINHMLIEETFNKNSLLEVEEMLYVYDAIPGDITRKEYFLKNLNQQFVKLEKSGKGKK